MVSSYVCNEIPKRKKLTVAVLSVPTMVFSISARLITAPTDFAHSAPPFAFSVFAI